MFRAELYGKRLKEFEASGFPSCILNNAHFLETSHKNQKSFMMSGKVGTFSKQNGICRRYFFLMRILYTKLQSCSLCYRETNWFMQKIPSVTGIFVQSVKTTTYVCSRFNTSFCNKDHKTQQAISCYTLLHQAARGEGKNSLRKHKDILVFDRDQQRFSIILIT